MDKPKAVGIWIRVSTEDQARGESPEHHEKRARYYAESKGWEVKELYNLEGVSGKSVKDHPEAQRMLADMRSGRITALIFSKLARLARNTKELLEFADFFKEHDADLISLQESIDTSSPAGRLFYTMIAAMAQWEREEISSRVAASVPIRAKLGKRLGGPAIFGYQWKENKLIPDPKEAPVRKLLYELFLQHHRKKTVARLLNEAGYRTRKGAKFTGPTVERLLEDSTAKGIYRANYSKSEGVGKKWVLKPEKEWVFTNVEPIISEEIWEQCNHILGEQEKKNKQPTRTTVHLFAGYAFCSCGHKMYVPSNSPKYICFKCRNKISTGDLEEIYQEQLKSFFFSSSDMADYLSNADKVIKDKSELVQTLNNELTKIKKEMDLTYRLYLDEKLTSNDFGIRYNPLTERLTQIEEQIPELQGEIDFLKIQYLSSDQILNEAKDLYSRWPELIEEEKRRIIENITEKIIVDQEEITINLCYIPNIKKMAKGEHNLKPFCALKKVSPDL